jgi:hypothetical protein
MNARRARTTIVLAGLTLVAGACGGTPAPSNPPSPRPVASSPTPAPSPPAEAAANPAPVVEGERVLRGGHEVSRLVSFTPPP